MLSLNTRSLLANGDKVQELISKTQPHIVALQETWQTTRSFEGYNGEYISRQRKRGGGVGILVKEGTEYEVVSKKISANLEHIAIQAGTDLVVSVYMPPTSSPKHAFEELQQITVCKPKTRVTILGDFNIDMGLDSFSAPESSPTERFHDFCRFNQLNPCVWKPTRVTKNSATVIDNILTSEINSLKTGIFTADVADHLAPFIILPPKKGAKAEEKTPKFIEFRVMSEENIKSLKEDLKMETWQALLANHDTNEKTNLFQEKIQHKLDTHCPRKRVKFNKNIHFIDEAMTQGLLVSRGSKQALYDKWIRTKDSTLADKYRKFNTLYNTLLRKSKGMLHKQKFEEKYKNAREMWQYTNQILSRKKKSKENSITLKIGGETIANQQLVAEKFNDFFSSIGQELVDNFDTGKDDFRKYMPEPVAADKEMKFLEITDTDYFNVIKSMKAKKSTGFDDVSNRLIKDLQEEIRVPIMDIINMSLCTGIVPKAWKIAKIIPLHKGGNKMDMNNYRPISLLSALSKILEKVVHYQTYNYVENKILTVSQFGFRKQRETAQAVLAFMKNMKENNEKPYHMAVFIDIKRHSIP